MSGHEDANELKSFEARLASLSPRDDRLDRERLMFLMGQALGRAGTEPSPSPSLKGRGDVRGWQAAFGAMSAVAATLMCMLFVRPASNGVVRSDNASPKFAERAPSKAETNALSDNGKEVLVVRDAFSSDIEERMQHFSEANATTTVPLNQSTHPPLTPTGWRRAFDSSTSDASEDSSSTTPRSWRVHA